MVELCHSQLCQIQTGPSRSCPTVRPVGPESLSFRASREKPVQVSREHLSKSYVRRAAGHAVTKSVLLACRTFRLFSICAVQNLTLSGLSDSLTRNPPGAPKGPVSRQVRQLSSEESKVLNSESCSSTATSAGFPHVSKVEANLKTMQASMS